MEKVIANRTCRDVINRIAKKLSQLSQDSCQCALLFNFDKNKVGEKRVTASKIWVVRCRGAGREEERESKKESQRAGKDDSAE